MKKSLIGIILVCVVLSFNGCTKEAYPNFLGGKYYMAGDDACQTYDFVSSTQIMCYDDNNKKTGYRTAMTNQQLLMYQNEIVMEQQALQGYLNRMNYNNQQRLNRNNVYKVHLVGPYGY